MTMKCRCAWLASGVLILALPANGHQPALPPRIAEFVSVNAGLQ